MNTRDLPSSVMLWTVNDPIIEDHDLLAAQFDEIRDAGFAGVAPMVRCSRYAWNHPASMRALSCIGALCARDGLAFWLVADPRGMVGAPWSGANGVEVLFFGESVRPERVPDLTPVLDGAFSRTISIAPRRVHTMPEEAVVYTPLDLAGAWTVHGTSIEHESASVTDIAANVSWCYDAAAHSVQVFGRLAKHSDSPTVRQSDSSSPHALTILRCATNHIDFSNPVHIAAYCDALTQLAACGVQPDALLWDEPGYTCLHGCVPVSRTLEERYARAGMLPSEWWKLALDASDGTHVPLRIGVYRALQQSIADARDAVNVHVRTLWGEGVIAGMHDTWRWESADPSDLTHGSLDLWSALRAKSAGFTDLGSVQLLRDADAPFHANLATALVAAASLGRHSSMRFAAVNLWTADEDAGDGAQAHTLGHCIDALALFGCRWIAHIHGPAGLRGESDSFLGLPYTPGYPAHSTWAHMPEWTSRLAAHHAETGALPRADVCVLFPVETIMSLGGYRAQCMMEDVFRIVLALTDAHYQIDLVAPSLLRHARWEGDALVLGDVRCACIVAPHATVLPAEVHALLAMRPDRVLHVFDHPRIDVTGAPFPKPDGAQPDEAPDASATGGGSRVLDFVQLLRSLGETGGARTVTGPPRSWITRTGTARGALVTLVPARAGWEYEGVVTCGDRSTVIPASHGITRVLFRADGTDIITAGLP